MMVAVLALLLLALLLLLLLLQPSSVLQQPGRQPRGQCSAMN
jgi:hypothetical protein